MSFEAVKVAMSTGLILSIVLITGTLSNLPSL